MAENEVAEDGPTPWRHAVTLSEVEASTGTTYWTVDPVAPPGRRGALADLVAPPILVGAVPIHPAATLTTV